MRSLMLCADRIPAPRSGMKSQRLAPQFLPCFRTKGVAYLGTVGDCCTAGFRSGLCPLRVCAVTRRRFPVDANPTRQPL